MHKTQIFKQWILNSKNYISNYSASQQELLVPCDYYWYDKNKYQHHKYDPDREWKKAFWTLVTMQVAFDWK